VNPAPALCRDPVPAPVHDEEVAAARGYVEASRAPATRKAYDADWRRFVLWCRARDAAALPAPPALVTLHLSALAARGLAPPSVARALAAIAHAHQRVRLVAPHRAGGGAIVAEVLAGIRRSRTQAPDTKLAADADIVMQLLGAIAGDSLAARRDRVLIAFGMVLAARRSELVAPDVADLAWQEHGLRVTIRRSITDQEGAGAVAAVPEGRRLTPLLRAWLHAAGITEGPVFRPLWKGGGWPASAGPARQRTRCGPRVRDAQLSGHAVFRIVQARALAAGLDPALRRALAPRRLRHRRRPRRRRRMEDPAGQPAQIPAGAVRLRPRRPPVRQPRRRAVPVAPRHLLRAGGQGRGG